MSRYHLMTCSLLALAIACPGVAAAQTDGGRSAGTDVGQQSDIVVTATRREETILDVPISISAFDQATLDTKGVRSIADLARITPGVTFTQAFTGTTFISIRGIASTVGAGTTGVYIDETPVQVRQISLSSNAYPAVFDLERIEVLRGPQGTLFGAGAQGGAVRFILPKPGLERYSGYARAELGFTKGGAPSYEAGAAIGGPIVQDRIGFRASVYQRRAGGYVDRVSETGSTPAVENSNTRRTTVAYGALAFAPTERLTVTPSLYYQNLERDDTDQYLTLISDPQRERFVNSNNFASPGRDKFYLYSVKAEYELAGATVISNTSFLDRRNSSRDEFTASLLETFGAPYDLSLGGAEFSFVNLNYRQKAFTQELRLQSAGGPDTRFNYVVGLFYQNSRQVAVERDTAARFDDLVTGLFGVPPILIFGATTGPDNVVFAGDDRTRDRQYAAFAQIDYKATDELTLTAGGRLARTEFDFSNVGSGPLNGGVVTTGGGGSSQTPFTPKLGVEYKADGNWLLYASAAKGFRPGGANAPVPAAACAPDLAALGLTQAPAEYDSDTVWSYEAGVKGRAGGAVTVSGSVFNIDWNGIQRPTALRSCGLIFVSNLGTARSRGFDGQITVRPLQGLSLDAAFSYTDATFRDTLVSTSTTGEQSTIVRKGDRITAPWIVTVASDYETSVGAGNAVGYLHLQYDFKSRFRSGNLDNLGDNPATATQDDTHFVSARAGIRLDSVDLSVFVDNLLDSTDVLSRIRTTVIADRVTAQSFRPRTIGATASYRF